ncbi:hypothetical protein C8D87_103451 [Lentzea atacamensis]|uniref:Uncharacterized protein n=1 Tax=Lentzea atacamensis TaxID=531938 RepID=A0ABX9EED6_9PSEU|nr:hypothetical protein [Lentzea atacamensis]RAS67112.1 hypothetical protein C8D87_103451 [Lentzea atacamensis]
MTADTGRRAWLAAGVVFFSGFGALQIASLAGLGDDSLPGLHTFRSATVGDGILLPLLAFCLVRSSPQIRTWRRAERWAVATAGVLGLLGGAATQISWLANPDPRLNWTLPAPGTFNAAGWYHAAFLTGACGFFAAATTAAIVTLRRRAHLVRSPRVVAVLGLTFTFVALLAEDNAGRGSALAAVTVAVGTLAVTAVAVLVWATGVGSWRWCVAATVVAAVPAVSLSLLFLPGSSNSGVAVMCAVCAALGGAFVASVHDVRTAEARTVVVACAAVTAAGPVAAVSASPSVTIPALASGCLLALAVVTVEVRLLGAMWRRREVTLWRVLWASVAAAPITLLGLASRYFAQEPRLVNPYAAVAGVVAALLFLAVSALAVRMTFDEVVAAEEKNVPQGELGALKWRAYLAIIAMYTGALISCAASLVGTSTPDKWIAGSHAGLTSLAVPALLLAAGLVVMLLVPAAGVVAPVSCLAWTVVMALALADGYGDTKQLVLSVVIAVVAALFVWEGLVSNVGYLHNTPVDLRLVAVAACAALAVGSTVAWMTGPALWSASEVVSLPVSFAGLALGVAACISLPWCAARTLPGARPARSYTLAGPLGGTLQDCFIAILLCVSVAWAPNMYMAHLADAASWWSTVLPFLALLSAAYVYVMKNNIGHVQRERRRVAGLAGDAPVPADQQRALKGLATHVRRQNVLALVALVPLGFFLLFNEITGFDRNGLKQILAVGADQPHS